jgi:hypothetical protein
LSVRRRHTLNCCPSYSFKTFKISAHYTYLQKLKVGVNGLTFLKHFHLLLYY